MTYKVIAEFRDKEDNNTFYIVNEAYPKGDHKPSKKRLEELLEVHPKHRTAFIKEVKKKSTKKE